MFLITLASSCNFKQGKIPVAKHGVLDLTHWDFEKDGIIRLDGEWEFYWKKLYKPKSFLPHPPRHTGYFTIPGYWNNSKLDTTLLTGQGYATYRLKILLKDKDKKLGIRIGGDACSSHNLWVDDSLISFAGVTSSNIDSMRERVVPNVEYFGTNKREIILTLQISNNFAYKGGYSSSIELGSEEKIKSSYLFAFAIESFFLGLLLTLFLYHFFVFLQRKTEKVALYFALLCLVLSLRIMVTNTRVLYQIFPSFDLNIGLRMEYWGFIISGLVGVYFYYNLYPNKFAKKCLIPLTILTLIEVVITVFTSSIICTSFLFFFQIIILVNLSCMVQIIIKATFSRQHLAKLSLIFFGVIFLLVINDILYANLLINTMYLSPFGLFLLMLSQAYLLTSRYNEAFSSVENLTVQLNDANIHLEQKVEARTAELKNTQLQLIHQEKLASLGELTAGIAHEIKNPLNFVNNFAEISTELIDELLISDSNDDRIELAHSIKQNLEKINFHGKRADSIIKNMLQHSRGSSGEKQQTDINKLTDEFLNLSFHSMRARYKDFNCKLELNLDKNLPLVSVVPQDFSRVLLNLFNNACFAVYERSRAVGLGNSYQPLVRVKTKMKRNTLFITVMDNGVGIPEKNKSKIFEPFFSTKPTGEGTGLGLSLSYEIIAAHHGKMKLESKENQFTEFTIQLTIE